MTDSDKPQSAAAPEQQMQSFLAELPADARPMAMQLYSRLSTEQKSAAQSFLAQAQSYLGLKETKKLLELVRLQIAPAFAGPRRVCIVGPVNTGKSSLYNALLTTKDNRAAVSSIPGTTREAQEGSAGILAIVDTPGADDVEVGLEGEQAGARRREVALDAAAQGDLLVIVFDASVGITRGALDVYHDMIALGKPYVVALNKIDLVRKEQAKVVELAARNLGLEAEQIIPVSALHGTNLERLVVAIARANPELLATLGALLPAYRSRLAAEQISAAAGAAGTVNLATAPIPIPFASFIPLTAIQAGLVLSLARLYGHRLDLNRAKELVATFGVGFGARTLFQQLITKVPGPGWLFGTALAAATTAAIGWAAQLWFERGERLTNEAMRDLVQQGTTRVAEQLRVFGKRPADAQLSAGIDLALQDMQAHDAREKQ